MKKINCLFLKLFVIFLVLIAIPLSGVDLFDFFSLQASAKSIEEYSVGDIITFGSYPQGEITDNSTKEKLDQINKEWISYGYYSGTDTWSDGQMKPSDYMKYSDISYNGSKYRAVTFSKYRPNCTGLDNETVRTTGFLNTIVYTEQEDNGYYTGKIYYFKYEPLQWRVLNPEEGFVMCESIIDSQPYNNFIIYSEIEDRYYGNSAKTYNSSDYANSSIRTWLNDDFYNTAFNDTEKSIIGISECENSKSTFQTYYDYETTYDKIFLISYWDDLNSNYDLETSSSKIAQGTDYAKCQGLSVSPSTTSFGYSSWLLRSPYDFFNTMYVNVHGNVDYDSYCVTNNTNYGIRPALKFNPNSIIQDPQSTQEDNENNTDGTVVQAGDSSGGFSDSTKNIIIICVIAVVLSLTAVVILIILKQKKK